MKSQFLIIALFFHLAVSAQKKELLLVGDTCVRTRVVTDTSGGVQIFFTGFVNPAKNPVPAEKASFWIKAMPVSPDGRFECIERITYSGATEGVIKDGWRFLTTYNFYIEIRTPLGPRVYKVILKASFYSEEG
jgi:hypothetical protein